MASKHDQYRVPDCTRHTKTFNTFAEARAAAEEVMASRHDDEQVMIEEWQEEGFWEPHAVVTRNAEGQFVRHF